MTVTVCDVHASTKSYIWSVEARSLYNEFFYPLANAFAKLGGGGGQLIDIIYYAKSGPYELARIYSVFF